MKEYDVQASFWNNPTPFTAATSRNDVSIMVAYTLWPLPGYIIFIFLLIYTLWHTPAADHLRGGQHWLVATRACFGFTSSELTVALALLAGKRGKLTASGCGRGGAVQWGLRQWTSKTFDLDLAWPICGRLVHQHGLSVPGIQAHGGYCYVYMTLSD